MKTTKAADAMGKARISMIGSWPGYGETHNAFIQNFLDGLAQNDCQIVSFETVADLQSCDCDFLLLHWVDAVFWTSRGRWTLIRNIARFLSIIRSLRPRTKIVWIVHNLEPNDLWWRRRIYWKIMTWTLSHQIDGALTLSPGTVDTVRKAFPGLRRRAVSHVWHPAYAQTCTPPPSIEDRDWFGLPHSARVVGYCGTIRPYKGIERLISAFRLTSAPDLRLIICGKTSGFTDADIRSLAGDDDRIVLMLGHHSYEDFESAMRACDIIAAPFRQYLHSGSMVHALSVGVPILTPQTPFSTSLAQAVGGDWIKTYSGPLTADLIETAASARDTRLRPDLSEFQPNRTGRQVRRFLQTLDD